MPNKPGSMPESASELWGAHNGTLPRGKEIAFLRDLADFGGSALREELPPAPKEVSRMRQYCRRRGWAAYRRGCWELTDAGLQALRMADIGLLTPRKPESPA